MLDKPEQCVGTDDELTHFEAVGAPALPEDRVERFVEREGARIWYAAFGSGPPVVLLHGGLGHSGNWSHQVAALVDAGYQAVVVDSRGHGRSTRDARPYTYELMAADVCAVLDDSGVPKAAMVGWSDGACTALVLARNAPERVACVLFFACNMDPGGTKDLDTSNPLIGRCFKRHAQDYARLSPTPGGFESLVEAVSRMQADEPNYTASDLAAVRVPVTVVQGEHDEFIKLEHAEYLCQSIPESELLVLPEVTHFAPVQRPVLFNDTMLGVLQRSYG